MASLDISQLEVLNRDGELFNNTPYTTTNNRMPFTVLVVMRTEIRFGGKYLVLEDLF